MAVGGRPCSTCGVELPSPASVECSDREFLMVRQDQSFFFFLILSMSILMLPRIEEALGAGVEPDVVGTYFIPGVMLVPVVVVTPVTVMYPPLAHLYGIDGTTKPGSGSVILS